MRASILIASALALCLAACGDEGDDGDNPPPGSGEDVVLVCSDPDSPDNVDGDGDGYTPCDGDCDDEDTAFHPDAPDTDGDRIDNNCDNWMPQRT